MKPAADHVWIDYWNQYFFPLKDEDVPVWEGEMLRIPGVDQAVIIRAVRSLAQDEKAPKHPKLGNLCFHIRRVMQDDYNNNAVPDADCGMCENTGMVYRWIDEADHSAGYDCIPCLCSRGKRIAWLWAKDEFPQNPRHIFDGLKRRAQCAADQRRRGADPLLTSWKIAKEKRWARQGQYES